MANTLETIEDEFIVYYKKRDLSLDFDVGHPGIKFKLIKDMNSVDFKEALRQYTHWMSYFSAKVHYYASMSRFFDRRHKFVRLKHSKNRPSKKTVKDHDRDGELEAYKYKYGKDYADDQLSKWRTQYNMAEQQRDMVSRVITVYSSNLKTIGRE